MLTSTQPRREIVTIGFSWLTPEVVAAPIATSYLAM